MKFIENKKILKFLMFSFLILELISFINLIKISTNSSAAKVNQKIQFAWEQAEKDHKYPLIAFWDYNSSPLIDKNFIQGSWKFLNPNIAKNLQNTKESGKIIIKAPEHEGIYKVMYCYEKFKIFKCENFRNMAIISCFTKNLNHIKNFVQKTTNKRKGIFFEKNIKKDGNKKVQLKDFKNAFHKNLRIQLKNKYLNPQKFQLSKKLSAKRNYKISQSNIEHIIIFISENHSFDSIYGSYCKAPTFSNPDCNYGPECCEAAPKKLEGFKAHILNDKQNTYYDPCHHFNCLASKMNGGKMDKFILNGKSANPKNFAVADEGIFSGKYYFDFARQGSISDRFFSSSIGASCQNNMYFATGKFMFQDNQYFPQSRSMKGNQCTKHDSSFVVNKFLFLKYILFFLKNILIIILFRAMTVELITFLKFNNSPIIRFHTKKWFFY